MYPSARTIRAVSSEPAKVWTWGRWRPRRPPSRSPARRHQREVESKQLDGIPPCQAVHDLRCFVTELLSCRFHRVRPGAILVRIVSLEDHIPRTDAVEKFHSDRVLEEATPDLPVVIQIGRAHV